jgi:hypothetical protein
MKRKYVIFVTALLSATLHAQTFKGHQIGESTADFLKSEPSLQAKLVGCQATAPRELTPEEIKKLYGRRVYDRYIKEEAQYQAQGKRAQYLDQDPDAYSRKCGALVDALAKGNGEINESFEAITKENQIGYKLAEEAVNVAQRAADYARRVGSVTMEPDNNVIRQKMKLIQEQLAGNQRLTQVLTALKAKSLSGRDFMFDNGALRFLSFSLIGDYDSVRDDVTGRLGVAPREQTVPFQNTFGATWNDINASWDTETLRAELAQEHNPSKSSGPFLSVQTQRGYKKNLELRKNAPSPLDN